MAKNAQHRHPETLHVAGTIVKWRNLKRRAKITNERVKTRSAVTANIGNAIIIGGIVASLFVDGVKKSGSAIGVAIFIGGLLYGAALLTSEMLEYVD